MLRIVSRLFPYLLALAAGCGDHRMSQNPTSDLALAAADMAAPPADMEMRADMPPPPDLAPLPDLAPPTVDPPAGCNTALSPSGTSMYSTLSNNQRCMGPTCHDMGQTPKFSSQATFMSATIGKASGSVFQYVSPNQPNNSYLLYKLSNLQSHVSGGGGAQMPNGGTPLNDADLCVIYDWVLHGAPSS